MKPVWMALEKFAFINPRLVRSLPLPSAESKGNAGGQARSPGVQGERNSWYLISFLKISGFLGSANNLLLWKVTTVKKKEPLNAATINFPHQSVFF